MGVKIYMLVMLSMATTAIALTITKAYIFSGVRAWVTRKNVHIGELVSCPYCTSNWIAFFLVTMYWFRLIESPFWVLDLFVSSQVIVCIAGVTTKLIALLIRFSADYPPEDKK